MTQWKLVPVEPTREMIEAAFGAINYTMPEPSEDAGRVYAAMLSAAPSPAGEEVERVANQLRRFVTGTVDEYEIDLRNAARAAIAAMRPTNQEPTP